MTTAVWLTSRQVHLGIVIYPRSNIFFQLCSYSTFATGRRETRDFHPPLNTFQVCIAGTRKILRFNFFPLKSVGKLQRFMPFSGGNPIPKIALGYLLTLSWQGRCWSLRTLASGLVGVQGNIYDLANDYHYSDHTIYSHTTSPHPLRTICPLGSLAVRVGDIVQVRTLAVSRRDLDLSCVLWVASDLCSDWYSNPPYKFYNFNHGRTINTSQKTYVRRLFLYAALPSEGNDFVPVHVLIGHLVHQCRNIVRVCMPTLRFVAYEIIGIGAGTKRLS